MRIIPFSTLNSPCPYLADRACKLEYHYIENCTFSHNANLVKHGFRRFGKYFQKPICDNCNECKSVRIDVLNFKFSKSLRRVMNKNKNKNTKTITSRPILDDEHIRLFNKYHDFMHEKKQWRKNNINFRSYFDIYVDGFENFGYEISYYSETNQLICVDLIDLVDDGISSIYCFWDPDFSHLSLGKYSLLKEIEYAKNLNLHWIYIGYLVKDCPSLRYKDDYKPYQTLLQYCDIDKNEIWEFL